MAYTKPQFQEAQRTRSGINAKKLHLSMSYSENQNRNRKPKTEKIQRRNQEKKEYSLGETRIRITMDFS